MKSPWLTRTPLLQVECTRCESYHYPWDRACCHCGFIHPRNPFRAVHFLIRATKFTIMLVLGLAYWALWLGFAGVIIWTIHTIAFKS